ncbi:MAG TPA: flagellar export chaperone FliS [Nocardioidaceae bacterium]|nr:flagellar export chaperone FliS [Nocardioidaceae bacterium]
MSPSARSAYMNASVTTANPARLLVMLYDRLLLDLQRGLDAQRSGDHELAAGQLLHAQDIVAELRNTLRADAWEGGPGLAALYDWLHVQLVRSNVDRDAAVTESCLAVVQPLAQAWSDAAAAPASA